MSGRKSQRRKRSRRKPPDETDWTSLQQDLYLHVKSWLVARVASDQEAEDLAAEVLARVAAADTPADLNAYVATAAKNALRRYQRRQATQRDLLRKLWDGAVKAGNQCQSEPSKSPEDGEPAEERAQIERILSTLSPAEAQLLRLRFLDNLPIAEVARRVGCSPDAAKKKIQRTIDRLRRRYAVGPDRPADEENSKNL